MTGYHTYMVGQPFSALNKWNIQAIKIESPSLSLILNKGLDLSCLCSWSFGIFLLPHPTIFVTSLLCAGKCTPKNTLWKFCALLWVKNKPRAERFLSPRSSKNYVRGQNSSRNNPYAIQLVSLNSRRLARVRTSELAPHTTAGRVSASSRASWRSERGVSTCSPTFARKILNSDLSYSPGRQSTFPSQSCPGTIAPIYRLVPPACKCHGDDGCLERRSEGPGEDTGAAQQGAAGSHSTCHRPGWGLELCKSHGCQAVKAR